MKAQVADFAVRRASLRGDEIISSEDLEGFFDFTLALALSLLICRNRKIFKYIIFIKIMRIVNEISVAIVKNARDGESIHSLAAKMGFAYSAVYGWVSELEKYGVISLIRKGNRNVIKINKNLIYRKFKELDNAVSVIEKDNSFWRLVKTLKLKIRFVRGTATAIWTSGSFITGDFYDRIYFLEVDKKDVFSLKKVLKKYGIAYTEGKMSNKRPLVWIIQKENFKAEKKQGLPVMPLRELVEWGKELHLENILEQLNMLHNLGLNAKYAEVSTNV